MAYFLDYSQGEEYFTLSLRELQQRIGESETWNGGTGVSQTINALACARQLLTLKVGAELRYPF